MDLKRDARRLGRWIKTYLEDVTIEYRERIALKVYPELRLWIREAEEAAYNRGYRDHETIRQIEAKLLGYRARTARELHPAAVAKKNKQTKTKK